MTDIDFRRIVAHEGAQTTGFEELCCQLARREATSTGKFERFRGAGGDGGVECLAHNADGTTTGWQSKYVYDFDDLLKQLSKSLDTAISIHKTLTKYVVCFPFDLTGKTGRKGTNQSDKFAAWASKKSKEAKGQGREITIESWPANQLRALLLQHDAAGGMRHFFFSDLVLGSTWFLDHITAATRMAGPRYTGGFNVTTQLDEWFHSFGNGDYWANALAPLRKECATAIRHLHSHVRESHGGLSPEWPSDHGPAANTALTECELMLAKIDQLQSEPTEEKYKNATDALITLLVSLAELDSKMSKDFDAKHGAGKSNSKSFRRFMAEHMCTFPAGNLDSVRDSATAFKKMQEWLLSPSGFLIFRRAFVLGGAGGSGKTHGICDVAHSRHGRGERSCIVYGHQFNGEPAFWTRLSESLGLGATIGKDKLLDALAAAGEASGKPLIVFVDAINETRPRTYWLPWLDALAGEIAKRSFLKLCVSCRSSFYAACLPASCRFPLVEHTGFEGIEREACNAFFSYYDLEPPLIPILQPELSNPLYLKLVCQTLQLRGLKRLPNGWLGLAPVIRAFLEEKEKAFAQDSQTSPGAGYVSAGLLAIAGAIAETGGFAITWSEAEAAILKKRPQAQVNYLVDWLVKAELLIEDGPGDVIGGESILRPAFERFGDFLVARELISKLPKDKFEDAFRSDKALTTVCANPSANAGVVQALSVLVSENSGVELPNLVKAELFDETLQIAIRAIPWRTPDTFTEETRELLRKAMTTGVASPLDSILAVCTQRSDIDAIWFSRLLNRLNLVERDSVWCGYLHQKFEENGIVRRLILAADDLELRKLDDETTIRWTTMLLWFTAAADRRVKDSATRALIAICRSKPNAIPTLLQDFLHSDDEELRERVLLVTYSALLLSREMTILKTVAESLLDEYADSPASFENALLRDHIRSIAEMARYLGCLKADLDPELPNKRRPGRWPLMMPTEKQLEEWAAGEGAMKLVEHSALHDDFNHYSIGCLGPWMHEMDKVAIGEWIIGYIGNELGFASTDHCDHYDQFMSHKDGGGRSKPAWAERIGKKHQWLALYKLASHLHDNVDQKVNKWDPTPVRTPLILLEERKMDPTLSIVSIPERKAEDCWWVRKTLNFKGTKSIEVNKWIQGTEDVPTLDVLLQPNEKEGQRWIPLHLSISDSEHEDNDGKPYRHGWVAVQAYLVSERRFQKTIETLDGRNFFGGWLPEGGKWLYTFVGEYPWGTACNTEPDYYMGVDSGVRDTDLKFSPTSNEICAEWEYDGSLPSSIYLKVPSKLLMTDKDFWWNGTDGFKDANGKTVFFDPRIRFGGPTTLLADLDALTVQLDAMGVRLFWTMLGKKDLLGGSRDERSLENVFSQVAYLNTDGTITSRPCVFFDDEKKDRVVSARW